MRSQFLASLLLLASPVFSAPAPGKDSDCDAVVKEGQSIQKAIDNAKRGDRIVVEKGTYEEQLTITKDGIQLIGRGAKLAAPKTFKPNFCTGLSKGFPDAQGKPGPDTDAGICIYGEGTELLDYVKEHKRIKKYGDIVKNVVVTGFEVSGFNGENIAVIAGENVRIHDNKLIDGGQYGFLTVGSKNTVARKNVITATLGGFIAMCQDDKANAKFIENNISNYYIALCGQTDGGLMKKNTVKDCCVGPFIDPGKKGIKVIENTVSGRGKGCSVTPDTGAGIVVFGAQDTLVQGNIFENIKNNDTGSPTGSGAFISDDPVSGAKARGNVFKNNIFRGNDIDIVVANGTAGPNTFRGNQCAVGSVPNGLCGN